MNHVIEEQEDVKAYLKHAAIAWEVMRLVYTLAIPCLLLAAVCSRGPTWPTIAQLGGFIMYALSRIVLANAIYNLGPLTELYLCVVWGTRIAGARYFLAVVLTGSTLAFMAIAGL